MDESTVVLVITLFAVGYVMVRALHVPRPVPGKRHPIHLLGDAKFRSGDVILFHSNPWIQGVADGEWSHVGIVVVGRSGVPKLFEITGGNQFASARPLLPILEKELLQGDRVVAYRRPFPSPPGPLLCHFARDCVRKKVPYEHVYWRASFVRMFGWAFPLDTRHGGVGAMCSSIVCDALKSCGVLETSVESFEMLPADFGSGDIAAILPLRGQYRWGPLTFLRMRDSKMT